MEYHSPHKRIQQEHLATRYRGNFTECRHSSVWLAEKVIWVSKLRDETLTSRQRKALVRSRTESIFNLGPADAHQKDEHVLAVYMDLFDDMFFFGSLYRRCAVKLCKVVGDEKNFLQGMTDRDTAYERGYVLGVPVGGMLRHFVDKLRDREAPLQVEITLFTVKDEDRSQRLKGYLSTLLHEMCHAFLDLWGCRYEGCFNVWEKQGVKGHGYAWQDIALAVEIATADPKHLNMQLDLGRGNSLAVETVYAGMPTLSEEELARWHMKQEEIEKIRKIVKDQHLVTKVYK